jgi:hypothetical protein
MAEKGGPVSCRAIENAVVLGTGAGRFGMAAN